LRCASGELDAELGEWWSAFYEAESGERERLVTQANARPSSGEKKKRAPRRGPRKHAGEGSAGADTGAAAPAAAAAA
ncbi:MAG TPA: polynucleotide adenylyltransferase PcnB, partial [Massilia sp.]|nr:polynucleotide adenylyltransferase PcnB [Massilia sp.]